MSRKILMSVLGVALALGGSAQVRAGKTVEVVCGDGRTVQIDKANNTPLLQARLCKQAGHPPPMHKPTTPKPGAQEMKKNPGAEKALLLPAVQAAREAGAQPKPQPISPHAGPRVFGQGGQGSTADTSCNGVASCNDMIATCIALGGNVTPTSYDPNTGAPDGATCFTPGH